MMAKLNFQMPLLQSSVSHDPSEIILIWWFAAQETFPIIIILLLFLKQLCCLIYVIFCDIINVFTFTFDQLNAFLLDKSSNAFQKKYIYMYE